MPLNFEQRDDIVAHISDLAEANQKELNAETFLELLFNDWDNIVDLTKMAKKAKRRELKALKEARTKAIEAKADMDRRIKDIEDDLAPKGKKKTPRGG